VGEPELIKVAPGATVSGVAVALPSGNHNPLEPDGNPGNATVIGHGEAAVASIAPANDQDWFTFTTTSAGQRAVIRAIADGFGSGLNPTLTLYSTDGSTVLASPVSSHPNYMPSANAIDGNAFDLDGPNFDAEIDFVFPNAGTYYFKVESRVGATSGRYLVTLELPGEDAVADANASLISTSARGIPAGSTDSVTLTVTPRDRLSQDLLAPNVYTVDLLDVSGATPVVLQTLSGSAPFEFNVSALANGALRRYSARIDGVPLTRSVDVVHYGALSLSNSRIVRLVNTLNANGYDRVPVRVELRDGMNRLLPDASLSVTLDTTRGTLDNGTTSGSSGVPAVFEPALGVWMIELIAGTSTGTATLTAYANGQQIDTATITVLPRAAGTGSGNGGGDGGRKSSGNGCSLAGSGAGVLAMLALLALRYRRRA
jgi:hypothetical protein